MERNITFDVALKMIQLEGTLAWEYNPFRNYRLDEDMIYYKNLFYDIDDFCEKFNINKEDLKNETDWSKFELFPKTEEIPIVYQKGLLVDFITDELNFDLNHPVQITPQYSYDNSVDLIINDGISKPKLINSRFSAIGKNKYKIIDRNGNNDTNIYDKGEQFKIDTSLYKITSSIPKINFGGVSSGGNLKIGNYHFYFKSSDLDGNESDFVAQSGLVSIFIGNNPNSINTGFRNLNSNKTVRFILSNIDRAYDYILVYYSRATSEEYQNRITEYCKIELKFKVSQTETTIIDITGFEVTSDISREEINERLQIYDSAKTLAVSQNMLFLGNVTSSNENHDKLSRLALYFIPYFDISKKCEINNLDKYYRGSTTNTYYNSRFIYNYTGYWDDEIYRFGIVFIKNDNTLTSVYNIRGLHLGSNKKEIKYDKENLITYDETTFEIDSEFKVSDEYKTLENAKGVCYIPHLDNLTDIIGINIKVLKDIINELKELGIKGYFIVRLKRIPTTLCQAYTIGIESESHIPMIPIYENSKTKYLYESFLDKNESNYTYFVDGKKKNGKGNLLSNGFDRHERVIEKGLITSTGAICPDYDVNTAYLNSLFTGSDFVVTTRLTNKYPNNSHDRLYDVPNYQSPYNNNYHDVKIIGVEDDVKLVGIGDELFAARAGEAEEAWRYSYVGNKIKKDNGGNNLIRGSFGTYIGITDYDSHGDLIDIKIPGYNVGNMQDYFKIRYFDASEFYPISDRFTFDTIKFLEDDKIEIGDLGIFYRGDCYICKFTHRLNRNFRDPSTPTNDDIVDPACWTKNVKFEDDVLKTDDLDKINLGDVNAVNLGMWITFILRSNINHSVRSLNESYVDETASIGNCRGFYPYHPLSAKAAYKLPESGTYNKGFEASVGEQIFMELPVVPYYRDIYSTRIAYSNLQITSAFKNAYRVFQSTHYRDYPITYGEITKIIEWNGDLICVLEHGIYKIPINERAVAGEGSGGIVYINTSNVLPENPMVISDTFGSLWIDSIIKTPIGIYGVDTVAKKIWKVDNNGIELISDKKVQEFLNNNITFTERELTPILGLRNVKTHYNAFKHDVMFTFYDDLNGISECVWNLCWNEIMNKWITFYSWVPSFSENIYNTYFSFDRETSKLIAKLALNEKSEHNDYIYLDHTLMTDKEEDYKKSKNYIGTLNYDLVYDGATVDFKYEIVRDVWGNYNHFQLVDNELYYTDNYENYIIDIPNKAEYNNHIFDLKNKNWFAEITSYPDYINYKYNLENKRWESKNDYIISKIVDGKNEYYNLDGKKVLVILTTTTNKVLILTLNKERLKQWKRLFDINIEGNDKFQPSLKKDPFKPLKTYILNIRVTPIITYNGNNASYAEYVTNKNASSLLTGGYIERTICVIPEKHLEALSTDFWRHGLSGIFDITEDVKSTKWYGKQHPFEMEFIVRDQPDTHKIFDNLMIISNKAEPESFHYEVIGECYEFAKDKKNMYIRQEATKELFQNCGNDIEFNSNYKELLSEHRPINNNGLYEKSTIFPAYYMRQDSINTVEDYYHSRPNEGNTKYFKDWSGAEIVYYKNLNEFRIWNHVKANNLEWTDTLRGNMKYTEDKWCVQIPSINLVLCNEPDWKEVNYGEGASKNVPIELKQANFFKNPTLDLPPGIENISPLKDRGIVLWNNNKVRWTEIKPKDKYIKIRIRYSGEDLAIVSAIKTFYSISYA